MLGQEAAIEVDDGDIVLVTFKPQLAAGSRDIDLH